MDIFYCKKLSHTATIPTKGSFDSAGFDLYANNENPIVLKQFDRSVISTGISVQIPRGWYGRIAPRSGLALFHGIDVLAGVVDSDYTGEIKVILINLGPLDVDIRTGDRIAQLIIEKCGSWVIKEVEELKETERGVGGFGSTGI